MGDAVDGTDTSAIVDTLQDISDRSVSALWPQAKCLKLDYNSTELPYYEVVEM